jgi:hypothetical protein
MPRYNHMFDTAFSLESNTDDGSDVTPAMLRAALLKRIDTLDASGEWLEACGLCDTYEILPSGQGRHVPRGA